MSKRVAYTLSVLFHPLFMPTFLLGFLLFFAPETLNLVVYETSFKFYLLGFLFLYTFLVPAITIYWFKKLGLVESLELKNRKDRPLPMIATAAIYLGLSYFLMFKNPVFGQVGLLLAIIAVIVLLIALISYFWQISAHAAGLGGTVGGMLMLSKIYGGPFLLAVIFFFLLSGLVAAARLRLNAHTPAQLVAGFFLGLLVAMLGVYLF
jgi:membrane-associated phospholipid phosphatase